MKIAFVGKGGSGKTTLAALFARYLAAAGLPVLAIDADINQNLAEALGAEPEHAAALPPLSEHLTELKNHLRGSNPRIKSASTMLKTTPPGRGSRLLRPFQPDPVFASCMGDIAGVKLLVTGSFAEADMGVACYHSKVGTVELLLNHMVDDENEYVVVDMTAGADAFASGLFTRFDLTTVVCEPTLRSVGVYRQYVTPAREFGVAASAVGNKVTGPTDQAFLRTHLEPDLLGCLGVSGHIKATEQGLAQPIGALEPENRVVLDAIKATLDAAPRDWARYTHLATLFHVRNAEAWGNVQTGTDLSKQIDPDFILGPESLSVAVG
jgi:CO dehydrogenase maturation factor